MKAFKKLISLCRNDIKDLNTNNCINVDNVWYGNDKTIHKTEVFICSN